MTLPAFNSWHFAPSRRRGLALCAASAAAAWPIVAGAADLPFRPGVPPPEIPSTTIVRFAGPEERPLPPARLPVFYPPLAPALGGPVERIQPLYTPSWDAPAGLAPYVGEPFYAVLGLRLSEHALSRTHQQRLAQFHAHRDAARSALRARLAGGASGIAAAAGALEAEADELRTLLYDEELDWNRYRDWGTSAVPDSASLERQRVRETQTLCAAAFFVDGPSAAQRRLLLELAFELGGVRLFSELTPAAAKPGMTIFFLPETSRIELPQKLPPAVLAGLDDFLQCKHQLRREIVEAVARTDLAAHKVRKRTWDELQRRQAPLIAALEQKAEELRECLAPLLPPPPRSALPPPVVKLAAEYRTQRRALQDELIARLARARRTLLTYQPEMERLTWVGPPGGFGLVSSTSPYADLYTADTVLSQPAWVSQTMQQTSRPHTVKARLDEVTDAFAKETAKQQEALARRRSALMVATARALGLIDTPGEPIPADALPQVTAALHLCERESRGPSYADYETAVLRPGLSPAERRLLFNVAIEGLALPLPAALRRPVGRLE